MISSKLPTFRGVCGLFLKIYTPAGAILQFFLAILRKSFSRYLVSVRFRGTWSRVGDPKKDKS